MKAYTACVRPILEYAAVCWSPTSEKLNNIIEMVQHKAAKFVTNIYPRKGHYEDFSISRLLNYLNWDSLEERRRQIRMTMVYKILNGHVIIYSESLPSYATNNRSSRRCTEPQVGDSNRLQEPLSRKNNTGKTFFYSSPKLWNEIVPETQANAPVLIRSRTNLRNI